MKEVLLPVHIEELPEGGFLATSDELPGLVAQGGTVAETLEIAQDVAVGLIESYLEHGDERRLTHSDLTGNMKSAQSGPETVRQLAEG